MTDNFSLIKRKKEGDKSARDELILNNMGLVHSIAKRFIGRGYDFEDLCQIGTMGLIKASDRFDTDYGVQFSTYAVPLIFGEIRKFLRDDGPIKVSRSLKELAQKIMAQKEKMEGEGKSPTVGQLAESLEVTEESVLMALEAMSQVKSIYESVDSEGEELLIDKISQKGSLEEETLDKMALSKGLSLLGKKEKNVIIMRYFRNMTQSEIAGLMGISQVQVSRIESSARKKLKELLE